MKQKLLQGPILPRFFQAKERLPRFFQTKERCNLRPYKRRRAGGQNWNSKGLGSSTYVVRNQHDRCTIEGLVPPRRRVLFCSCLLHPTYVPSVFIATRVQQHLSLVNGKSPSLSTLTKFLASHCIFVLFSPAFTCIGIQLAGFAATWLRGCRCCCRIPPLPTYVRCGLGIPRNRGRSLAAPDSKAF